MNPIRETVSDALDDARQGGVGRCMNTPANAQAIVDEASSNEELDFWEEGDVLLMQFIVH